MPLTLTWATAAVLVADGFLIGIGWQLAVAIYSFILWVLGQRRPAPPA
jgi:hypothetical protein